MDETDQKIKKSRSIFSLISLALLIVLVVFLLSIFYTQQFWYRPVHRFFSGHIHRTLGVSDVNHIQNWMIFDYINRAFKLPTDYLKNNLGISDSRYPRLSLESYAENQKINSAVFLEKVKEAVRVYITSKK